MDLEVPGPPLFWVKKEEIAEGRIAGRTGKTKPPSPPLAQGLNPPLVQFPCFAQRPFLITSNWPLMIFVSLTVFRADSSC